MSVAKVVELVASSEKGFDDAIQQGMQRACKTLRGVSGIKIRDWTAKVENGQITLYKVTLDVVFALEGN
jgi:dodecin